MNNQPFFSIIIPMYNAGKYVARAIDSVLSQNFESVEIIVANDGSTDNGAEVVKSYAEKDGRIILINKENGGVSSARNCAMYAAKGMYMFFLDSDDIMWENALLNAHRVITENSYPDVLQTARVKDLKGELIYADIKDENYDFAKEGLTKDERAVRIWYDKPMGGSFDIVCTKFMKTEFIKNNGISFSTTYHAQEDNDLVFKIFRKADTVVHADFVSFCYYKYTENSVSSSWSSRSAASILNRWASFYFCEAPYMNLSKPYRDMVAEEKHKFLLKVRGGLFKLANQYSAEQAEPLLVLIEHFFEKEIRKLPYKKERFSYMYPFYKLLGVRRTVYLFRKLVKIRDFNKK